MPHKDPKKRKEYHREYYREYMRTVGKKYHKTVEKNRSVKMKDWKNNGALFYKIRRIQKRYGSWGVNAFLRDGCQCVECGEPDFRVLVLHHIIPESKGGKHHEDNLTTKCENCHVRGHFGDDTHSRGTKIPQQVWDKHWMLFAQAVAKEAKCYSRKIGAVIIKDNYLVSIGRNGPPRGVPHCEVRNPNGELECPRRLRGYKSGEGLDLCIAGHAEANAIFNAARFGKEVKGASMYCYCGIPCKDCLISIINAGIIEIVYKKGSSTGVAGGDYYDKLSKYLVENSDILVRGIDFN